MDAAAEARRTEEILAELERLDAPSCADCATGLCGHAWVINVAMGFRNEPRCVPCLAAALDREAGEFLADVKEYLMARACYRAGWEWASAHGGTL